MGNKKEFKALIKKYKSITLEDIKSKGEMESHYMCEGSKAGDRSVANKLTKFGEIETCTLCQSVNESCRDCFWKKRTGSMCVEYNNEYTYDNIYYAETPKQLLKAFKKRAKYMKKVLTNK